LKGEYLYSSGSKDTTKKRKQIQTQPKRIQEEEPLRVFVFVFVNLTPSNRSTLREHAPEEGTIDDEPWSWKNPKPMGLKELQ
jgi:hypothetical protein